MSLHPGSRLGPYEILGPLGAGGMGEVYRSRDTRLGRDVALKILPPDFRTDAERLTRFAQEARAAPALNHPNILAVWKWARRFTRLVAGRKEDRVARKHRNGDESLERDWQRGASEK